MMYLKHGLYTLFCQSGGEVGWVVFFLDVEEGGWGLLSRWDIKEKYDAPCSQLWYLCVNVLSKTGLTQTMTKQRNSII